MRLSQPEWFGPGGRVTYRVTHEREKSHPSPRFGGLRADLTGAEEKFAHA